MCCNRVFYIFRFVVFLFTLVLPINFSVNGFDLQCTSKKGEYISTLSKYVNSCTVQKASFYEELDEYYEEITSVNGKIEPTDYGKLTFKSYAFSFIPKGIENFFQSLEVLEFTGSSLQSIEQADLKALINLKYLDLSSNSLKILEDGLFDFNPWLVYVSLNINPLQFVGANIWKPLTNLKFAYFQSCNCIDSYYQNNHNSKTQLETQLRMKCPSPESVKETFCNDHIEALSQRIVELQMQLADSKASYSSCNANLESASLNFLLSSKQLRSCATSNKEFVPNQENVEKIKFICDLDETICSATGLHIKLKSYLIEEVKNLEGTAVNTEGTKELDIQGQRTLFLPTNLAKMFPNLNRLHVVDSGLFEINANVLKNLTGLINLSFKENKLLEIPVDSFINLRSLERLDLSMNNIENLEDGVYKSLVKLEDLRLHRGKFTNRHSC